MSLGDPLTECCAEAMARIEVDQPPPTDDGNPACDDPDGPIDTAASYQAFCDYWRQRRQQ